MAKINNLEHKDDKYIEVIAISMFDLDLQLKLKCQTTKFKERYKKTYFKSTFPMASLYNYKIQSVGCYNDKYNSG